MGRVPRSSLLFRNRPDQFPRALAHALLLTALTLQGIASHAQSYLLAGSCLQGLITSGQRALWCFAAGSNVLGATLGCRGTEYESCPKQDGKGEQPGVWIYLDE